MNTDANQQPPTANSLLERMIVCRQFELLVERLALAGEIRGMAHLGIGQEAVAAGIAPLIGKDDWLNGTYRNVTLALCLGTPPAVLLGELLGRAGGLCGGYGGHMHLFDLKRRFLGTDPVVGAPMALGAGAALAIKHLRTAGFQPASGTSKGRLEACGTDGIAVSLSGEGAFGSGISHEVLNLAKLWSLPVLFVIENNGYAISTPDAASVATGCVERATSYGIAAGSVDGNDVRAVHRAAAELAQRVRTERSPALLEARTYRHRGHSKSDTRNYRSKGEEKEWLARDPIFALARALEQEGALTRTVAELSRDADATLNKALDEARAMPWPVVPQAGSLPVRQNESNTGRLEACGTTGTSRLEACTTRTISYRQAINEALADALSGDERIVFFGQDIGVFEGAYKASAGLLEKFGPRRVVDTPIAELGVCQMLTGAAACGLRPIFEVMFGDFLALCADALVNHASKFRFLSGGSVRVPLIVRAPFGPGNGFGATHSQCVERWFAHVPGLIVAVPSTPEDVKQIYKGALQSDDPVLIFEPISLYANTGPVSDTPVAALTGARVIAGGSRLTLVTYGRALFAALAAREQLPDPNQVEIIDLRCLQPLDRATILASVNKTGALLVVEDGHKTFGIGGEILATVAEAGIPVRRAHRLSGADVPVAFSAPLEAAAFPSSPQVLAVMRQMLSE